MNPAIYGVYSNPSYRFNFLNPDMQDVKWEEISRTVFIDYYLQSIPGQLIVFLLASVLFTRFRSPIIKLFIFIFQTPFIFYSGLISIKEVYEIYTSDMEFSRKLFNSTSFIFVLTVILLCLVYQWIYRKPPRSKQKDKELVPEISFIKNAEPSFKSRQEESLDMSVIPVEQVSGEFNHNNHSSKEDVIPCNKDLEEQVVPDPGQGIKNMNSENQSDQSGGGDNLNDSYPDNESTYPQKDVKSKGAKNKRDTLRKKWKNL